MRFFALLPVAALTAVVAAAPSALQARTGSSTTSTTCNSGSVQCCNQTYSNTDTGLTSILGLLGVVLPAVEGLVGLGCTSVNVVGVGSGNTCTQQTVCCTGNTFSGLINIGCNNIAL